MIPLSNNPLLPGAGRGVIAVDAENKRHAQSKFRQWWQSHSMRAYEFKKFHLQVTRPSPRWVWQRLSETLRARTQITGVAFGFYGSFDCSSTNL